MQEASLLLTFLQPGPQESGVTGRRKNGDLHH
jgi:hypothetical protein